MNPQYRAGMRQLGGTQPAGRPSGSYGENTIRTLIALTGIPDGRATVEWERFSVASFATARNFGERWTTVHNSGGDVQWNSASPNRRGGNCVATQGGGSWTENYLYWVGPELFKADVNERWGIAFRSKFDIIPAANVNNANYWGIRENIASGFFGAFGYDGGNGSGGTFCYLGSAGQIGVTTRRSDSLDTIGEVIIVQKPVAGSATWHCYIDGVLLKTQAMATLPHGRPIIYVNKGEICTDDLVFACDSAFATAFA